jgi:hypothetical protein
VATPGPKQLAFVGNSFMYVNDLPRVMEAMSMETKGGITQQSCLHGGQSLTSLLKKGNGMYGRWGTEIESQLDHDETTGRILQDFGMCTVHQLLLGADPYLTPNNQNHYYLKSGRNPCFQDKVYYTEAQYLVSRVLKYHYVIFNDHSRRPGQEDQRLASLASLKHHYIPLLKELKTTIPVFLATHAYASSSTANTTNMGSVPEFTRRVYNGYMLYAKLLDDHLPRRQVTLVAPTGLAFLQIYDTDYDLWEKLFYTDGFHPSPYGTYLTACVLHTTIFRTMPLANNNASSSLLFDNSRRLYFGPSSTQFPTDEELASLNEACQLVGMEGYLPESFVTAQQYASSS